jgi:HlyD family secretion protein
MKLLVIILLVLSAVGGGWWYWSQTHGGPVKYDTSTVTRGDITEAVTATGQLNPVLNITVGSQISGNIMKLYADYNTLVKANQVVAELDPAPYLATVHQAQANVANAKAALELAELTQKRKQMLVDEHAAAQADLDAATASLHQAEANLQIQQANLESAQVNLDHCTITSPIDGIVISRSVDVGQTVAASLNAPVLFTIANDLSKMQIDASVAEADVGQLVEGMKVNFTVDAYPARTFHGIVHQVRNSPVTVQNVVTYDTVISVNNDDLKLKPGMTANVSIVVAQHDSILRVPNAALRFRPPDAAKAPGAGTPPPGASPTPHGKHEGSRTLYTLSPGATSPEPVQVHLGISDGINTEVLDGLKEGDVVINSIISGGDSHGGGGMGGFGMRRPF